MQFILQLRRNTDETRGQDQLASRLTKMVRCWRGPGEPRSGMVHTLDDTGKAVVLITAGSEDEAKRIQLVLLNKHLAACVSMLRAMNSMYWWQGKLETADEILLIAKTRTSQIDEIVNLVKQNHSYSVPEIIALPVVGGNADYLAWVDREATGSRGGSEKNVKRGRSTEV